MGWKRKDVALKAVSGNGLAAQPGAFAVQGFSWRAGNIFCSYSTALVWARQPLGLCLWWLVGQQVHFQPSHRSGREHAHLLGISYLLTAPWGTPWSYICACRDLSPPQNTSAILVKVTGREAAKHFLTFKADRHLIANCEIIAIGFSGTMIEPLMRSAIRTWIWHQKQFLMCLLSAFGGTLASFHSQQYTKSNSLFWSSLCFFTNRQDSQTGSNIRDGV